MVPNAIAQHHLVVIGTDPPSASLTPDGQLVLDNQHAGSFPRGPLRSLPLGPASNLADSILHLDRLNQRLHLQADLIGDTPDATRPRHRILSGSALKWQRNLPLQGHPATLDACLNFFLRHGDVPLQCAEYRPSYVRVGS